MEQIASIADSIVVQSDAKDAHWDEYARVVIESLIAHVLTWPGHNKDRTLAHVRDLLLGGLPPGSTDSPSDFITLPDELEAEGASQGDPFSRLLDEMAHNDAFGGRIARQSHALRSMGHEEFGSVLSTARRNTRFLDSVRIRKALARSDVNLDVRRLKRARRGASIYLCLPIRYMSTHARWFRLVLNAVMDAVERRCRSRQSGRRRIGRPAEPLSNGVRPQHIGCPGRVSDPGAVEATRDGDRIHGRVRAEAMDHFAGT